MSAHAKPASSRLYDTDFFAWTGEQARLLRAMTAESTLSALDIENIAEEIESLGRSDLRAVESQIRNILVHLLLAVSDPNSDALLHWREEISEFQLSFRRTYTASMRQRIDFQGEWLDALRLATIKLRRWKRAMPAGLPDKCPFSLMDLLAKDFDAERAEAKLAASISS